MKLNPAFASLMIDVPGSAPKYSKTKRISPQNASFIWDETFTFKIERSDLSAAQLRIRSFSPVPALVPAHDPFRDLLIEIGPFYKS